MDHATQHGSAPDAPFTALELEDMHGADRLAARNIVVLMAAIFVMGIAIYTVVDYFAYQS